MVVAMVAAALWDVLAKAANLAQLSGVHAVMLLAVALSLLRIPQCMRERAELERCARRLRALLQELPAAITGYSEVEGLVRGALDDADGLVGSYDGSTLWRRLRTGRTTASQFRDVHNRVESCCVLVLFVHACVLTHGAIPPPSSDATIHQGNVGSPAAETRCPIATGAETSDAAADTQRMMNSVGPEGLCCQTDNTEPECQIVTAIVISNA